MNKNWVDVWILHEEDCHLRKDDSEIDNLVSSQKQNKACYVLRTEGQKSDSGGDEQTDSALMIPGTPDRPRCADTAALKKCC